MPLKMEISIYTINFSYKKAISTCFFRAFPLSAVLRIISPYGKVTYFGVAYFMPPLKPHWGFRCCEDEQLNVNMYSL